MSDISDVLTVLANCAARAVYPSGTGNPSITGSGIVIYPGWPQSADLDADLAAGKTHVSIFPKTEERNTTRYPEKYLVIKNPAPTLTLTAQGVNADHLLLEGGGNLLLEDGSALLLENVRWGVTVGGTVSVPQNVMLRVNRKDYVYAVQSSDTLDSIASALAALVVVDIADTSASGASVALGGTGRLQAARVGGFGTVAKEIRRQERVVMLTVWAATPALRDQVAAAIDVDLAQRRFLTMPDGYGARIIYKASPLFDGLQKAGLYRRDLNYLIEFATTKTEQAAAVIAPKLSINETDITI